MFICCEEMAKFVKDVGQLLNNFKWFDILATFFSIFPNNETKDVPRHIIS